MIIDPKTRDLRSHMSKIVEGGKIQLREQVKAEMHQSVVEVGTNVCQNVAEARQEVSHLRKKIAELAEKMIHLSGLSVRSERNPYGDIAIEFSGLRPGLVLTILNCSSSVLLPALIVSMRRCSSSIWRSTMLRPFCWRISIELRRRVDQIW